MFSFISLINLFQAYMDSSLYVPLTVELAYTWELGEQIGLQPFQKINKRILNVLNWRKRVERNVEGAWSAVSSVFVDFLKFLRRAFKFNAAMSRKDVVSHGN